MNSYIQPRRWQQIVSKKDQDTLSNILNSNSVDWYITNSTVTADFKPQYDIDDRVMDTYNCTHKIYMHNDYSKSPKIYTKYASLVDIPKQMIYSIASDLNVEVIQIMQIRANTIFQDLSFTDKNFNVPHMDYEDPDIISILYYVDQSDGDTVVFDKYDGKQLGEPNRFRPIRGSAIAFNSNQYHCSSNPIKTRRRIVINACFKYKEK